MYACFLVQYILAGMFYALGRYTKHLRWNDLIIHTFVIFCCIGFYASWPLQQDGPQAYVFRTVIVTLRCSVLVAMFGVNGTLDMISSLLAPIIAVGLHFKSVDFPLGSTAMWLPAIFVTIIGVGIFNFLIILEQRRLYAKTNVLENKQKELLEIVDMFSGTVLIFESVGNQILFQKNSDDFECPKADERIFKIEDNFFLNNQTKGQIRLYNNVESVHPSEEEKELMDLKTYAEVIEISRKVKGMILTFRNIVNDQVY